MRAVERTADPSSALVQYVCVDHRRLDPRVTEQFLHGSDMLAAEPHSNTFSERAPVGVIVRYRQHRFLAYMPLLGSAAMLLSFDIEIESIAEHDHWHTYEHLPERLSIPGFLRGTRWVSLEGPPRYMVLYEVESLATLSSAAYLQRLNAPTPWTARMMTHYRAMTRGFCSVVSSTGFGLGQFALLVRYKPGQGTDADVEAWLSDEVLPELPSQPGLGSAHLLQAAATPTMTNEQRIRGVDRTVDSALIVIAHDVDALKRTRDRILGASGVEGHGGTDVSSALYAIHYSLSRAEIDT